MAGAEEYAISLPAGGETRPTINFIEIETDKHYHLLLPPELSRYEELIQYLIAMLRLRSGVHICVEYKRYIAYLASLRLIY